MGMLAPSSASAGELPVGLSYTFSTFVGEGTFVPGPTWNPYVLTDLAIAASYDLPWGFSVSAYEEAFLELTLSDATTLPMQAQLVDPRLRISNSALKLDLLGMSFGLGLNGFVRAPLSLLSRRMGAIGTIGFGADASFGIPVIGLTFWAAGSGAGNGFHPALADAFSDASQAVGRPVDVGGQSLTPRSCIRRSPAERGSYVCGVLPTAGVSSAATGFSWGFLDDMFAVNASVALVTFYTGYLGPNDQFTNPNARPGLGALHQTEGELSATFAPWGWLSFTTGTYSYQDLWTADGKWPRFPLWDFISPRSNLSTFFFSTTVSI